MNDIVDVVERQVEATSVAAMPTPMPAAMAEEGDQSLSTTVRNVLRGYLTKVETLPADFFRLVIEQIERPMFELCLEYFSGNQSRMAKALGISRGTLRKKLKIYGLLK
jgi:Fis family transcriptional regulator, factor for inversion stimulation protein